MLSAARSSVRHPTRNFALTRSRWHVRRFVFGLTMGLLPLIGFALYGGGFRVLRNVFVDRFGSDTSLHFLETASSTLIGLATVIILLLTLILRAMQRKSRADTAIALFCLALLPQALQRVDQDHVLFVACIVAPIAIAGLLPSEDFAMVRRPLPRRRWGLSLGGLVIIAGIMLALFIPNGTLLDPNQWGRSFYVANSQVSHDLARSMRVLDSHVAPNSRVLIVPGDLSRPAVIPNYIYYLLPKHIPNAYFLELAPGVSERADSGILSDLRRADVLIVSHFSRSQRRLLFPRIARGSEQGNLYVQKHFCTVVRVPSVSVYPRFDVAKRCDGPTGGG